MKNFIEKIRKINLQKAGWVSVTIAVIGIILHILVLNKVVPYQWVNGGRTESFEMAKQISSSSMMILVVNLFITLIAAQIIPIKLNRICSILLSIFLIGTLPFSFVGIIQQCLGTLFEKCTMSIVTLIGFLADVRVAVEKRW